MQGPTRYEGGVAFGWRRCVVTLQHVHVHVLLAQVKMLLTRYSEAVLLELQVISAHAEPYSLERCSPDLVISGQCDGMRLLESQRTDKERALRRKAEEKRLDA